MLSYRAGLFGLFLTVRCADYNLPENAYQLDDGRHDTSGDVTLRVACIHDNATSWLVTCHKGRWTTEPETAVDCTHARRTAMRDASSAVHVTASSSTNQGPCLRCFATSLADILTTRVSISYRFRDVS